MKALVIHYESLLSIVILDIYGGSRLQCSSYMFGSCVHVLGMQ